MSSEGVDNLKRDMRTASHGQRRIWTAHQFEGQDKAQVVPLAYRVSGPLDIPLLERCLSSVIDEHEALHSRFDLVDGRLARLESKGQFVFIYHSLKADEEMCLQSENALKTFINTPFDLARGPMMRALLLERGDSTFDLLILCHHIAGDGASFQIIQRQLSELYRGKSVTETFARTRPFSEYVARRRGREDSSKTLLEVNRLLKEISQLKPSESGGEPLNEKTSKSPQFYHKSVPFKTHEIAIEISERHFGLSVTGVYLLAFELLLQVLLPDDRRATGVPLQNREGQLDDEIVGFITNIVPFCFIPHLDSVLSDELMRMGKMFVAARGRINVPFGLVLRELHGDPFRFDIQPLKGLLTFQPEQQSKLELKNCSVLQVHPPVWPTPYDIMLDVEDKGTELELLVRWDAAKWDSEAMQIVSKWVPLLIQNMAEQPNTPIRQVIADIRSDYDRRLHEAL
jgi:hypothetical protein